MDNENDEINLMDYIVVMLKRKRLIIAVFILAVLTTGVLSFLAPKVYKIETILEIGKTDSVSLEDPGQMVGKINGDVYGIFIREKLGITESEYPEIKVGNVKETSLITMNIESDQIQQSKNILGEINNLIIAEHQEKLKTKRELIGQNIKTTEEKIKLVENDIEKTGNKIKPIDDDIKRLENKIVFGEEEKKNLEAKIDALQKVLVYQQDPGTQFALFDTKEKLANKQQEIEGLYLNINALKRNKEDLNVQINTLKAGIENLNAEINSLKTSLNDLKPTKIIKDPTVPDKPIRPHPLRNMGIAGVSGLFMGTLFAFTKEWWEKNKARL